MVAFRPRILEAKDSIVSSFGWEWGRYLDIMNVTNHAHVALEEHCFDRSVMNSRTIQTRKIPILPSRGCTIHF